MLAEGGPLIATTGRKKRCSRCCCGEKTTVCSCDTGTCLVTQLYQRTGLPAFCLNYCIRSSWKNRTGQNRTGTTAKRHSGGRKTEEEGDVFVLAMVDERERLHCTDLLC